jgi:hypothetical protein
MISLRGSVIILLAAYTLLSCTAMAQPPQMSLVGDLIKTWKSLLATGLM